MSMAYLVAYNGDYKDVTVEGFDSKELALEASGKSPKEKSLIIAEDSDLLQFNLQELVDIYNGITGSNLSRFRTLESGRARILTSIKGLVASEQGAEEAKATTEGEEPVASKPKKKAKVAKEPKAKKPKKVDPAKKIELQDSFKETPRREGSLRAESYSKMRNGTKVSTYLENGGRAGDLAFALKFGHIKLVD